jgi:hypothetical protein
MWACLDYFCHMIGGSHSIVDVDSQRLIAINPDDTIDRVWQNWMLFHCNENYFLWRYLADDCNHATTLRCGLIHLALSWTRMQAQSNRCHQHIKFSINNSCFKIQHSQFHNSSRLSIVIITCIITMWTNFDQHNILNVNNYDNNMITI